MSCVALTLRSIAPRSGFDWLPKRLRTAPEAGLFGLAARQRPRALPRVGFERL